MHNYEFEIYKLNEDGIEKERQIACVFDFALAQLSILCGQNIGFDSSSGFHAVREKLEEAYFHAKRTMSRNHINQQLKNNCGINGCTEFCEHNRNLANKELGS